MVFQAARYLSPFETEAAGDCLPKSVPAGEAAELNKRLVLLLCGTGPLRGQENDAR
jgi:hypothetical protein